MFRFFQQKKMVKQVFSRYVPVELIDSEYFPELKEQDVYFILIKIDNMVQNKKTPTLSNVINLAVEHNALVEQLMGPIILLSYGLLDHKIDLDKKDTLIAKIMSSNSDNVAVIHGKQRAYAGKIGNEYRCTNGTVLNNVSAILIELGSLNFGESKEIQ